MNIWGQKISSVKRATQSWVPQKLRAERKDLWFKWSQVRTLHFNWSTKGSVKNKQEQATRISEAVKHNCTEIEACMHASVVPGKTKRCSRESRLWKQHIPSGRKYGKNLVTRWRSKEREESALPSGGVPYKRMLIHQWSILLQVFPHVIMHHLSFRSQFHH